MDVTGKGHSMFVDWLADCWGSVEEMPAWVLFSQAAYFLPWLAPVHMHSSAQSCLLR